MRRIELELTALSIDELLGFLHVESREFSCVSISLRFRLFVVVVLNATGAKWFV